MQDEVFAKAVEAGGRLTVKSALNPILWLCAIITIPTFCAVLFQPNFPRFLVYIGCSPVIAALLGFLFLLIFDRDKLQSEDYQIKKKNT